MVRLLCLYISAAAPYRDAQSLLGSGKAFFFRLNNKINSECLYIIKHISKNYQTELILNKRNMGLDLSNLLYNCLSRFFNIFAEHLMLKESLHSRSFSSGKLFFFIYELKLLRYHTTFPKIKTIAFSASYP